MVRLRRSVTAAIVATLCLGGATRALAWEEKCVDEALRAGIKAARAKKDMTGYGPRADGMCLVGSFLERDGILTWKCKLKKGRDYLFVAAGDRNVEEIQLEALQDKEVLAKDDDRTATPCVGIAAEDDCDVTLRMKLTRAPEKKFHFCLLIMLEDKAAKGSFGQLEEAAKLINAAVDKIKDVTSFEFAKEKNSICLTACILGKKGWRTFDRQFEKGTTYMLVGAGDEHCVDLDLEVTAKDGTQLAKDDKVDSTPVVAFNADEKQICTTKVTMADAQKPAFAVIAILKEGKKKDEKREEKREERREEKERDGEMRPKQEGDR